MRLRVPKQRTGFCLWDCSKMDCRTYGRSSVIIVAAAEHSDTGVPGRRSARLVFLHAPVDSLLHATSIWMDMARYQ